MFEPCLELANELPVLWAGILDFHAVDYALIKMLRCTIASTYVASRTKGIFPSNIELVYLSVACTEQTLRKLVVVKAKSARQVSLVRAGCRAMARMTGDG